MRRPSIVSNAAAVVAGAAMAVLMVAPALSGAAWTDRGEYDLALLVRAEASAEKRLALLDQWKAKYPKTAHQQVRRELYLAVYQSVGAWPRLLETAREMVAEQPGNLLGLYWLTLLAPEIREPAPAFLDEAAKAARALQAKVSGAAEPEWQKRRGELQRLAHRTVVWAAWKRGAYDEAGRELTAWLQKDPGDAEMSAWLAAVVVLKKEPQNQAPALWHLARAAAYQGQGALAGDRRREASAQLERIYTAYHGGSDGLEELRTAAAAAAFPPEGFQVESGAAVAVRKEDEELNRTNPQLAAWVRIRRQLEAADGEKFFNETLRAAPLPRVKGFLVRSTPEEKPQEIAVGVTDPTREEVVVKLGTAFPFAAEPGAELEFEGAAVESFTREPFSLTVTLPREKVEGWPAKRARAR